jgi:hypothetical protein
MTRSTDKSIALGPKTRHVGSDLVVVHDDRIVVVSSVEMADWEVRRNRPTLIRFAEQTWRTARKTTAAGKTQYELVPWSEADQHLIGREIDYNTDYVARRDNTPISARRRSRVTALLRIISPLVGFLPGRTKTRLEAGHGIDPVASTSQSVFFQFLITLGAFSLASIGQLIVAHEGTDAGLPVALFVVIGLVTGLDGAVRWDRILSEQRPPPGFYEWLFRRK